ncbi:TniB family NTP-binding protein [Chromobacterium haemolyticum]|nr:TniB family NTP-binding protein [Chromobacterium haemolyticum]
MAKLEDLVDHPREARMPNMLLIGGSNNGKTRLIQHFAQRHPAEENPGAEYMIAPVLYVQAPPTPSEPGFYSGILNALFESVPTSSTDAKRAQVIRVLRGIQLKVLIIDELHNVLAGSSVKQQQFLNMIKFLGERAADFDCRLWHRRSVARGQCRSTNTEPFPAGAVAEVANGQGIPPAADVLRARAAATAAF